LSFAASAQWLFLRDFPSTNFSISFITHDGFKYSATEAIVSVAFNHRLRYRATSAGPPVMEMLSKPMPFTKLLPDGVVASAASGQSLRW
jgi:hypothetical protein